MKKLLYLIPILTLCGETFTAEVTLEVLRQDLSTLKQFSQTAIQSGNQQRITAARKMQKTLYDRFKEHVNTIPDAAERAQIEASYTDIQRQLGL